MKKVLKIIFFFLIISYALLCGLIYFFQEKIIFHPQKIHADYKFQFGQHAQEINIASSDGKLLNGILFKVDNSKGLIFYLHGNAGSLLSWGSVAEFYNSLNYDVFILDYRGFGKSQGIISSQEQLFRDNQIVYDKLVEKYDENEISILGYSIGTGLAARLASENSPKQLILQAPYYSMEDLMRNYMPFIPTILLKYKLNTHLYLKKCNMPVIIFHGANDETIDVAFSRKLESAFKKGDKLIILDGQGHNAMTYNRDYQIEMIKLLQ